MIFENWLNWDPVSAFGAGAAAVGGPEASESFMPPGFKPRLAASPPIPGRGLIIRGLWGLGIGAELKLGAPGRLIPAGSLMFARPPVIAPLGVVALFGDGAPPGNWLLTPELGSFVARFGRPWGPKRRL